jgi:hypothetical protein
MQEVSWGVVTSVSPLEVRFVGDDAPTAIAWKPKGVTLANADKVLLAKTGSTDGWVVVCVLVTS